MLEATSASIWRQRYVITADDRQVATWDGSMLKTGGMLEVDGRRYEVRAKMWGLRYGMVDVGGARIASADRVGRKSWTIEADGRTYLFRRTSLWRDEQEMYAEGVPVGWVKRKSIWRSDAVAHLPGLELHVQLFVLAVVMSNWHRTAASG